MRVEREEDSRGVMGLAKRREEPCKHCDEVGPGSVTLDLLNDALWP